jgi:hypothetical protein
MLRVTQLSGFMSGAAVGALLAGETDGLAVNFTDTTDYNRPTWAMQMVQERNSSVDTYQSPHVFFTQSGTSPKYVKNSATTIGWSPHNLCLQSQVLTTTWSVGDAIISTNSTVAPDGTTTGDTFAGVSTDAMTQTISGGTLASVVYTLSVYYKYNSSQWMHVGFRSTAGADRVRGWFDVQNGALGSTATAGSGAVVGSTITSLGSGWYRCTLTGSISATDGQIQNFTVGSDGSTTITDGTAVEVWGAQLNRGYSATAYMVTTTTAKIGLPISYGEGLLVEPAATNLYLRSQEADNASWVKTNSSIAANSTAAPDGSTTADTLTSTSTSNARYGMNVTGLTNDGTHTHSVYAKAGTASWLALVSQYAGDGSSTATWFNLGSGTVGTVQSQITSASITSVGGGWYRCSHTYTNGTATATTHEIYVVDGDNSGNVTNGVNIYIWGAQLEAGTVATSYIPTVAATATRARDDINVVTSAFPFSATNGTLIMRGASPAASIAVLSLVFDDGTTAEQIHPRGSLAASAYRFTVSDGNVGQCSIDIGTLTAGAHEWACSWAANDFSFCLDGTLGTDDSSGTLPTLTTFRIGTDSATTLHGLFHNVIYLPRTAANGELQAFTT